MMHSEGLEGKFTVHWLIQIHRLFNNNKRNKPLLLDQ